jgi:hypothetical protein
MRLAARMGEVRSAYKILVRRPEMKILLRRSEIEGSC